MKRRPNTSCTICQKEIYRRPSQIKNGSVYCSLRCTGIGQQKPKKCPICGSTFIGAKRTCSRTCANRSRAGLIYTKEGRYNNAYQGSLLKEKVAQRAQGVCERCDESNYTILQVHHKIERYKGGSNELNNLELLCPNCHAAHHLGRSLYREKKMI